MKNIYEQLISEHREVARLMEEIVGAGEDIETRSQLFAELERNLLAHAKAEQLTVYPRFREASEDAGDEVEDDLREHETIEQLIGKLSAMPIGDDGWMDVFADLQECVEHHVDDEENELFPEVRRHFSDKIAREIAHAYRAEHDRQLDSHRPGAALAEMSMDELYEEARKRDIPNRSKMNKDQLIDELRHR